MNLPYSSIMQMMISLGLRDVKDFSEDDGVYLTWREISSECFYSYSHSFSFSVFSSYLVICRQLTRIQGKWRDHHFSLHHSVGSCVPQTTSIVHWIMIRIELNWLNFQLLKQVKKLIECFSSFISLLDSLAMDSILFYSLALLLFARRLQFISYQHQLAICSSLFSLFLIAF